MDSNFQLNTDTPIDKVVTYYDGSVSLPSGFDIRTTTISHNLGFRPLPYGRWSLDPGFSTSNEIDNGTGDLQVPSMIVTTSLDSLNNTFEFTTQKQSGSPSTTVYFRLYGLDNFTVIDKNVASTSGFSEAPSLILDTDLKYGQIVFQWSGTMNSGGVVNTGIDLSNAMVLVYFERDIDPSLRPGVRAIQYAPIATVYNSFAGGMGATMAYIYDTTGVFVETSSFFNETAIIVVYL